MSLFDTIDNRAELEKKTETKMERKLQVNVIGIMVRKNKKVLPNHNISRMNYYTLKCNDTM